MKSHMIFSARANTRVSYLLLLQNEVFFNVNENVLNGKRKRYSKVL